MSDFDPKFPVNRDFIFSGEFAEVKKSDIHGKGFCLHLCKYKFVYVKFRCICKG